MKKILKLSDLNMSLGSVIGLLVFLVPALFAQWEPDVRLTYDLNNSAATQNNARWITTNGDTVHVVWMDGRDGIFGNWELYYKQSLDGGTTWGPDIRLTDTAKEVRI